MGGGCGWWAGLEFRGSATKAQHQEECALVPDAAVSQRAAVGELEAAPEQALLCGRGALPDHHLKLDSLDSVGRRHVQREGAAREGLDEDLHCFWAKACVSVCVCV